MGIKQLVGKRVKGARKENNLSQEELGNKVGYAGATISQLESGQFRISIESLEKIAKVLDKPLSFFLPEKTEKNYTLPTKLTAVEKQLKEIKKALQKEARRAKRDFVYFIISGNIGVGKSDLARLLASHFGGEAYLETEAGNPYLPKYYKNMKRWALHSQLYFLTESFKQHVKIAESVVPVFQDRCIHEQFRIFTTSIYEQEILNLLDYKTLEGLYETVKSSIMAPDLVIYLRAPVPTLMKRITRKGRGFEKMITKNYLEHLNQKHEEWIKSFNLSPTLTIDTDRLDFVNKSQDFQSVLDKINSVL